MSVNSLNQMLTAERTGKGNLRQYLPFLSWLAHYRQEDLSGDLIAGVIVAVMLVPQGMAYAMLAGLPPEVGLYAGIAPLIIYGLLGSSRTLAVGPVAIVSILVAGGVSSLAEPGSSAYVQLALTLALLVGMIQFVMGVVRLGFLVNFLSHPVLVGFINAAAIVIGFSQVKHLLGLTTPRQEHFYETVLYTANHLLKSNPVTLVIGLTSMVLLFYFKIGLPKQLKRVGVSDKLLTPITRSGPLFVVLVGTIVVWGFNLSETVNVNIVGNVPQGLPPLTSPSLNLDIWRALLPTALAISFVGYMESISVAKTLASKRRQKVKADQELIALGAANLGATLTGGYPVTGGFSRSVVNFAAGANTGLASIVTAGLMGLTVVFMTPLFYFLPNAILAAIIVVAVTGLFDLKTLKHIWRYSKGDSVSLIVTFGAVLITGIETGILIGVAATIFLFIWRTSRPHMAVVGRMNNHSETYRNILRHPVKTCPHVVAIRVDESLYFANTKYLEDTVLNLIADQPDVRYLVLIGIAINFIDASALETLEALIHELDDAGVELHLADIKGPVMDRLQRVGFITELGPERIHLSTHDAMSALGCT